LIRAPQAREALAVRVAWTEHARSRRDEAPAFVAGDRPQTAMAWLRRILDEGASLAELPDRGGVAPETSRHDVRELIVNPQRLVHRRVADVVTITLVAHGGRR
jgi:plasmid stabilization system protein ParE